MRDGMRVSPIDVDEVKAGGARPLCGRDMEPLQLADLALVHRRARLERGKVTRDLRDTPRHEATFVVWGVCGPIPELDAGKRAMLVRLLAHEREVAHVGLIPESRTDVRGGIALGVNRAVLGVDHPPAALCSNCPQVGLISGIVGAEIAAVGVL